MDALHMIAQKADGALRDSLSIFDQIVSFAGNKLTYKDVIDNLNILDYDYYFRVTDNILEGNIPASLLLFNEILSSGFDGHTFINGLAAHLRDLLVCQDASTIQLLEVSNSTKARYNEQSKKTPVLLLLNLLDICNRCDLDYKASKNQRLHVELALIRMCSAGNSLSGEKKNPELVTSVPQISSEQSAPAGPVVTAPPVAPVSTPAPVASAPAPVVAAPVVDTPAAPIVAAPTPAPVKENPPVENKPQEEKAAPKLVKGVGGMRGISLSAIGKPKQEESNADAVEMVVEKKENQKIDESNLQAFWMKFAERYNKAGGQQIYTTMAMNKPTMINEQDMELVIHNRAQELLVQEEKQDILEFLRRELKNDHLNLVTRIVDLSGSKELITSPKEKYRVMMQTNPDIDELRIRLGLEIDY